MQPNEKAVQSRVIPGSDHPDAVVDSYDVNGRHYDVVYSTSNDDIAVYVDGQGAEPLGESVFRYDNGSDEITIKRQLAYGYYELVIEQGGQTHQSGRPSATRAGERNTRAMVGYGFAIIIVTVLFREMQDGKVGLMEALMTITAAVVITYARRVSRTQGSR